METLLMVAVVVITVAVVVQVGVLLAMYLLARRISGKVEVLMDETRKLIPPLESIAHTLKAVADDLQHTAQIARDQVLHVQAIINETRENVRTQVRHVREGFSTRLLRRAKPTCVPSATIRRSRWALLKACALFFPQVDGSKAKPAKNTPPPDPVPTQSGCRKT